MAALRPLCRILYYTLLFILYSILLYPRRAVACSVEISTPMDLPPYATSRARNLCAEAVCRAAVSGERSRATSRVAVSAFGVTCHRGGGAEGRRSAFSPPQETRGLSRASAPCMKYKVVYDV